MKILLIEDNHLLGPMLVRRLQKRGHTVTLFSTIREVDDYVEQCEELPDVIVTDQDLSDGNGWNYCVRWWLQLPKIVFMSGNPPDKVSFPFFFKGVDHIDKLFELIEK